MPPPLSVTSSSPSPWIRRYRPESEGRTPLVCFPPAGAPASFFAALSLDAPAAVDPWAIALPGREARLGEPAPTTMAELADAAADELAARLDGPAVLLGHSMGGSVAHEVARRLEARGPGSVLHLVVGGRGGPATQRELRPDGVPDDAALVDGLAASGDTPRELLEDPDVLDLLLPPLRADYALLAAYVPEDAPRLRAGITAIVGRDDPTTTEAGIATWAAATDGPFAARTAPGGHLFLAARTTEVVDVVRGLVDGAPDRT
ncbi:thioesterase II family protein [Patulibacter sp.]|uniref:thioesterase II family protein n=1 Tax=Patulibacter sp. TaxID=1912859 RepID=UPI0027188555|nr:alpha/beta fold hydrolase [Patulibacter sp.]MDO9407839.1 alpha/beta fold hydrolase [Patulibacter sp.]